MEIDKLYCMDCLKGMSKIPDQSVDLVVTDPPYGINFHSNRGKKSYLKSTGGIAGDRSDNTDFLAKVIDEINRVLKPDTHIYWFTRWDRQLLQIPLLQKYFKVKNSLVWMKDDWSMGDLFGSYAGQYENILFAQKGRRLLNEIDGTKRHSDILKFDRIPSAKLLHSHQKPVGLIEFLIKKSSTIGDVVLDPFIGSGSTAVAALDTNRHFVGFEIDKDYYNIANRRIASHSDQLRFNTV